MYPLEPESEAVCEGFHDRGSLRLSRLEDRREENLITNTFFSYKNDRPIVVTLYSGVVMLQRAQGGCLGTESR